MMCKAVDRSKDHWYKRVLPSLSVHLQCLMFALMMMSVLFPLAVNAQVPNISYTSPQVYPTGTAISTLSPTNSGGAVPALTYRNVSTLASSGINGPNSITTDALGNVYIAATDDKKLLRVTPAGVVSTIYTFTYTPLGIAINGNTGDLYISVQEDRILKIINTNSANYPGQAPSYSIASQAATVWIGDGTTSILNDPVGMAVDATNTYLYVVEYTGDRVKRIQISDGSHTNITRTSGDVLDGLEDIAIASNGDLYVSSSSVDKIHKLVLTGTNAVISTFAGGTGGLLDGPGANARFQDPRGLSFDAAGNLYVSDGTYHSIRRITPAGYVSTFAGPGTAASTFSGTTDGVGTSARFNDPRDVFVVPSAGFMYVAERTGDRIRKVDISGYTIWPTLPDGLSMNATTGVITGTPTARSRQVYYQDDFDDANGGTGTSIVGSAAYASGWMRLTDDLASQDGAFKVDASGTNTNGLQVEFSLITGKSGTGADGISYSFASDALTTGGTPELGTGTGLSLGFVTYSSSTIKMNLYYGNGRTNTTSIGGTLLASNTANNSLWLGRNARISLVISDVGKVTVKVDGTTIFNEIQLPAEYLSANKATWYHVFRARTGGSFDLHAIDDLVIRQSPGAATHTITATNTSGSATATLSINTGAAPTVTSTTGTSITATGAASGGNVTAQGDASVTARGVVWSSSPNPTVALTSKTDEGAFTGSFTSTITGLSPNITYYYRAYATNSFGTNYGTELSFTTLQTAPNISFSSSSATLTVGTPVNITLTNTGGTPDVVQVSTLAGDGTENSTDGVGVSAKFRSPSGVAVNAGGILFVADAGNYRIRKIDLSTGVVTTLAGPAPGVTTSINGYADGTGTEARFNYPRGIAVDGSGNLYVADQNNNRIRMVTSAGVVTTLAGPAPGVTSSPGFVDGAATSARFSSPQGVAVDASGNVYVADRNNHRIRMITPGGVVTTLAGPLTNVTTPEGYANGPGSSARFNAPSGITIDASGNLYVGDANNHRIRRITSAGVVELFAGATFTSGGTPYGFIDGTWSDARFFSPFGVAVDASGALFVADKTNNRIRKIASGVVTTLAGPPSSVLFFQSSGFSDGTGTAVRFRDPYGMAVDANGNVYVADETNNRIRIISRYRIEPALPAGMFFDARTGTITGTPTAAAATRTYTVYAQNSGGAVTTQITLSVAAPPTATTQAATNVTASSATLNAMVNANGGTTSALTIKYSTTQADVDAGNGTSATVSPTSVSGNTNTPISAAITGLAANTTYYFRVSATNSVNSANGSTLSFTTPPSAPVFSYPGASSSVTLAVGTLMTELTISTSSVVEPMQVSTLAGSTPLSPTELYADGTGTAARFNGTSGVAVDASGNVYVADKSNHRIRRITADGVVTTLAGPAAGVTPTNGYANGTGTSARFNNPTGIAVDASGNVYVADNSNSCIRKVTAAGVVTTLAGPAIGETNIYGFVDGTTTSARFRNPTSVALDANGNVYVADRNNHRIRMVTQGGVVTTLAGPTADLNPANGYVDGTGTSARFQYPEGVAVDANGNVYVASGIHDRIRKVTSAGVVTTLAGPADNASNTRGYADGTGTSALFFLPTGAAVDASGNVYIAEVGNSRIRKVTPTGVVTTLAGPASGVFPAYGYADGTGTSARFESPYGIAVDASGNVYVAESYRIRKLSRYSISPALPAGLSFNPATGTITGTPTAITPSQTYTVTASNGGGTGTTTITLAVGAAMMTTAASDIGETTATTGGTVGSTYTGILARGVVLGTSANPSLSNTVVPASGTTTGDFTVNLTGLTANTVYYVRSYVTYGSSTTDYGNEVTFKTNELGTFANITKTFGDANFSLTAPTAVSTGAFTFASIDAGVATVSGSEVTIVGPGTTTITATQAAAGVYALVSKALTLTVNKATPAITLDIPTTTKLKAANDMAITGTSSNGATVSISIDPAKGTLSPNGPGAYKLNGVVQTGDITFTATTAETSTHLAGSNTVTMNVEKDNQTITFGSLTPVTYSNGLTQALTATTSATGLTVTYTLVSGPGSITGSTLTITGPGLIKIRASQAGNTTYNPAPDVEQTLTVNPGAPTITGFTPTSATQGDVVTITGTNFQDVTSVKFNTTAATSFTVVNATTITAVVGTGHTGAVSVTTTGGTDTEPGFRFKVTWTGATNAFNQNANWTGNRPPQTDDDIIFSPNASSDLELDGSKTVGNVDFNGSSKSLRLGGHNLTVKGNLTMPGNINGSGKLIMGGSVRQTIRGGGDVPELEITNTDGVEIDASGDELTVSGTLSMGANGKLTTNGKLRLTSNSGGTARVPQIGAGATITGNVIAERYIQRNNNTDGTGRAWRLVSVPVTGTGTLRDFFMNGRNGQDLTDATVVSAETENSGTPIVGHNYATASEATSAGFDWIGVANSVSSLRSYVGSAGGGSFASENVPDLTTTFAAADQGYMVFARGDRKLDFPSTTSSGSTTFRSTGTLKTGSQTVNLEPASTSKYTLVGNPYMSVLDLGAFYTTNSSKINPSFWIWDANISGTNRQGGYVNVYQSGGQWVTNTGTYINPELLESGMAFFVEPASSVTATTTINIEESHKSSSAAAGLSPFSTDKPDDHGRMYIRLERADARGQRHIIDGVMADFHASHKVGLTDMSDREKLRNGISRGALWIPREGKALSGEGLPWPTEVKRSIPLYMSGVGDQTLLVHINPLGMRDRYVAAWLKDNVLNREVEINMSKPFDYDFIGTGRADWDSTRFEIIYQEAGRPGTGVTLDPDGAAEQPSVKLYPNPSRTAQVRLSLRAMAPGAYTVQVLDMTGRLVSTSSLQHRSVNGEYRVLEGRLLSPGQYLVRLIDADKQLKETLRMMVE